MKDESVSERIRKIAAEEELKTVVGDDGAEKTAAEVMESLTRDAVVKIAYEAEMQKIAEEEGIVITTPEELGDFITKRAEEITVDFLANMPSEENVKVASEIDDKISKMTPEELQEKYADDVAWGQGFTHGFINGKEASLSEEQDGLFEAFMGKVATIVDEATYGKIKEGMEGMDAPLEEVKNIATETAASIIVDAAGGTEALSQEAAQSVKQVADSIGEQVASEVAAIVDAPTYEKIKEAMDEKKKPGYFARNMAASRAMRASDTGVKSVLAKKELIKARTKNMPVNFLVIPAASTAAGAGLGRLVKRTGAGAVVGATIGLGTGYFKNLIDMVRADKKYLKGKGMNMNQFTGNVKLSPEAAQKYLHKKYVGGGYGK